MFFASLSFLNEKLARVHICMCENCALQACTGPGKTWANGMNFFHAPCAGSLAQPVDLQSSMCVCVHAYVQAYVMRTGGCVCVCMYVHS